MASPPKPWERAGAGGTSTGVTAAATAPTTTAASASASEPPALPSRPSSLSSTVNQNASNYSTMNRPYGYGGGYGSSYSSPYSSMGSMGGMGGYGYGSSMYGRSMYGGGMYGGGYGGYGMGGGMYGGMGGMPGDPNNPQGLTQSFSQSTAATFQMLESIVGAFGGFAQMLESTYMATHSSFFAMVSVAEQFGTLRQTLGSVLGIFTLMRWIRTAIAKLTGRPPPASSKELTPANFHSFNGRMPDGSPAPSRPSKKPFIMFMLTVIGLPYLMGKLIRAMARSQEEEERRRLEAMPADQQQQMDPSKLEFCRVLYDFTPEANTNAVQGVDLAVKKGDLVAVLGKTDPMGNASEWWRCRSRDGRTGYLPSPYLEVIQRRPQAQIQSASQAGSPAGSRAQTMTSSTGISRTGTMKAEAEKVPVKAPPPIQGKAGDMGVESFQKNMFQS
ncbi:putative peroxisomal membrane protein [Lasiodiplodia theobromae]|uniref:Peroxisomal membrane protein PEX13 n=1 Tax=Lasiodiplodia theobromae TaxID=45133 RepID=A0A5N5D8V2_9PEZI|nr:Peroxisomal membrane protein [Lasiodiplodia theobromae]KAB2574067.1 Peroxisomal membrane protein PEX13 [Lasiodiplodia theobromae]KAF4536557.1 Peroxisomal membrane protein [Lasiodiplodia theobromae]KAF9633691.1 putative peroxisomal membrane protein [Lasiodiplodia theobromae]